MLTLLLEESNKCYLNSKRFFKKVVIFHYSLSACLVCRIELDWIGSN